jgi:metallophosphoesterase (TIGR03767 family)
MLVVAIAAPLAPSTAATGAARSSLTTLDRTIVSEGDKDLAFGPGERRVTRTLGWKDPGGTGIPLVGFKHLSDVHVIDEESPARVEWLDGCETPFNAAYRVQEAMSLQVGDSMLRRLARIRRGPATNVPLDFLVSTGDNIDNNQLNELRWFIRLLDGGRVDPNSGGPGYHGYTQEHFAPALPVETLELAQEPFDAVGAQVPWYAVQGNHDGLVQGNAPQNPGFETVAVGGRKVFVPIDGYDNCPDDPEDSTQLENLLTNLVSTSSEEVPADAERVFVDHEELVEEFFQSDGRPRGHGLARAPQDPMHDSRAGYYSFKMGPHVRGISLDTISYDGVSEGHIPDPQFRWLRKELRKWSGAYWVNGKLRSNPKGSNRLVVLFSHHSSPTLRNPGGDAEGQPFHCFRTTDQPECETGEGLKGLLHRFPNVVAWVNGHEHNNAVRAFPAPGEMDPARGFWEVNTASHIDWPQQSRLIEIAYDDDFRGDTVFIYTTVVDHAAAPDPNRSAQSTVAYLSSVSRVEAWYDGCVRTGQANCEALGRRKDRNVKLVIKAPFDLPSPPVRLPGPSHCPRGSTCPD